MNASTAIATILLALLVGAISPGPSFVVVARNAIGLSRDDGLATALGMGVGGVCFSCAALVGFYTLLESIGWLYVGLKVAGGVYLVYLALKIWRGALDPLTVDSTRPGSNCDVRKSFWIGLSTQLSNPKTAIVYGSIFAALLPQDPPLWCYVVLPPLVFAVEAGWYVLVAVCFSSRRPREAYLNSKIWIDRVAATVIFGLGVRLISAAYMRGV